MSKATLDAIYAQLDAKNASLDRRLDAQLARLGLSHAALASISRRVCCAPASHALATAVSALRARLSLRPGVAEREWARLSRPSEAALGCKRGLLRA